jgi:hypothetical protein
MDASVSQGFSRQAQQGQAATGGGAQPEADGEAAVTRIRANGLLDLYA